MLGVRIIFHIDLFEEIGYSHDGDAAVAVVSVERNAVGHDFGLWTTDFGLLSIEL